MILVRLMPAPLHRAGLRLAHALRKRWWRLARPRLTGCRVIALDGTGHVLLIRHSYGSGKWAPPGGGMKRGEDAVATASRELLEETGCVLHDAFEVSRADEMLHGAVNRVHVVAGRVRGQPRADRREVIAVGFFAEDALPADMAAAFHRDLPGWITAAKAGNRRDGPAAPAPPATTG